MEEQGLANGASWQRMAVWLARAGYGDLEYSTAMTLQALARPRGVADNAVPERAAALPVTLAAAAD